MPSTDDLDHDLDHLTDRELTILSIQTGRGLTAAVEALAIVVNEERQGRSSTQGLARKVTVVGMVLAVVMVVGMGAVVNAYVDDQAAQTNSWLTQIERDQVTCDARNQGRADTKQMGVALNLATLKGVADYAKLTADEKRELLESLTPVLVATARKELPLLDCGGGGPGVEPGTTTTDAPPGGYASCHDAAAAGARLPLRIGDPGYNPALDGNANGLACE